MDISRRAYSVDCRFLKDSDQVSKVRWAVARDDAPVLPFMSIILSRDMEPDKLADCPVGEVSGARRKYTGEYAPPGINGRHYCGTEEDFNDGGKLDTVLPDVQYNSEGWPICCNPPRPVRGGLGIGGKSVFARMFPGPTCPAALPAALDTVYHGTGPTTTTVSQWYRFPAGSLAMHVDLTGLASLGNRARMYLGADCPTKMFQALFVNDIHFSFFNATAQPFCWVEIFRDFAGPATPYTVQVGYGP